MRDIKNFILDMSQNIYLLGMGTKNILSSRYGYKNGEGLGRENQGLTTALSFVRTSGSRGVIVNKVGCVT